MATYLEDNPPRRSQYRRPRRERPSGLVVVHSAENTPDFVAFDGGAEAVARFIQGRTDAGSYHDLVDSDSTINLVPYDAEAYQDGTGSNPHAYAVSVATRADVWPLAPQGWRDGAVEQAALAAARYADWLYRQRGITIPARRITRTESEARTPGFISHAERDPARRTDPGAGFPWQPFLARFAQLTAALGNAPTGDPAPPPEEDPMNLPAKIVKAPDSPHWWVTDGITRQHVKNRPHAAVLIGQGAATAQRGTGELATAGDIVPWVWPAEVIDSIRLVGEGP